ncbi:hypothetical protein EK904_012242 [Melospiza melodia maxima]|nr:hypothetical protein EK904_012242 [Melospiza melodia maxima]
MTLEDKDATREDPAEEMNLRGKHQSHEASEHTEQFSDLVLLLRTDAFKPYLKAHEISLPVAQNQSDTGLSLQLNHFAVDHFQWQRKGLIPGNCQRVPAAGPEQKCGVRNGRALKLPATLLHLSHTAFDLCLNRSSTQFTKMQISEALALEIFRACCARCHHLGNLELCVGGLRTNVPCPVLPQQCFGEDYGAVLCYLSGAETGCCRDSSRKSAFPQLHHLRWCDILRLFSILLKETAAEKLLSPRKTAGVVWVGKTELLQRVSALLDTFHSPHSQQLAPELWPFLEQIKLFVLTHIGFVCALKKPKPWGRYLKEKTEYHFTISNRQKLAINKKHEYICLCVQLHLPAPDNMVKAVELILKCEAVLVWSALFHFSLPQND